MVVPIDEKEAVQEAQFDAVASEEVGDEGGAGDELCDLGAGLDCAGHGGVDLDLEIEVGWVAGFGFGEPVEEVVEQEEVVEEVVEGERRQSGCGRGLSHYYRRKLISQEYRLIFDNSDYIRFPSITTTILIRLGQSVTADNNSENNHFFFMIQRGMLSRLFL